MPFVIELGFRLHEVVVEFGLSSNHTFFNLSMDVVPIPAAAWLFGSSLLGVLFFSRGLQKRNRKEGNR